MKPIIREYLSSLRERNELDVILPDIISEMGFNVISRPSIGVRQYGVDVVAVGPVNDDRLYLFSIKRGDLTRADWDNDTNQGLRTSLNEIQDVYIKTHIPDEHRKRKIVICLCFGGDVHEQIRLNVMAYINKNKTDNISYEEWNGDRIAGYIETGLLREGLLTTQMRSSFRKAIAMLDEPETSFYHFSTLLDLLLSSIQNASIKSRVTASRQICICLWILFAWSRDAGNVESAYLSSERSVLSAWHILRNVVSVENPPESACLVLNQIIELHFQIADELNEKVIGRAEEKYAASAAVRSSSSLDINIAMFETLGRVALRGLWMIWGKLGSGIIPVLQQDGCSDPNIDRLATRVLALVASNPSLLLPALDDQVVDLTLAFMFLILSSKYNEDIKNWLKETVNRLKYAFCLHKAYPCVFKDYRDLVDHPKEQSDEYRTLATSASVLIPTLGIWAAGLQDQETLDALTEFSDKYLKHCAFQIWVPSEDSEENIYNNLTNHGSAFLDIPVDKDMSVILTYVLKECGKKTPFFNLSAVKFEHWPIILIACRHHRLPIPPHLFLQLFSKIEE